MTTKHQLGDGGMIRAIADFIADLARALAGKEPPKLAARTTQPKTTNERKTPTPARTWLDSLKALETL